MLLSGLPACAPIAKKHLQWGTVSLKVVFPPPPPPASMAVSVTGQKPDCKRSTHSVSCRNWWSCLATTLAITLHRNGRLDTGLKRARSIGSSLGFLRRGLVMVSFSTTGVCPHHREAQGLLASHEERPSFSSQHLQLNCSQVEAGTVKDGGPSNPEEPLPNGADNTAQGGGFIMV